MNTKNNKRFKETEIRMQAAMLNLMKHTEFEKITVKKICEEANVNRSTFYAHFVDIYDMINKMEQELRRQLSESYKINDENTIFSEHSFILFLDHIKEHKYFYKINLQTRKSFSFEQDFDNLWNVIETHCEKIGIEDKEEIYYYFIGFQASFTMILKHWIDTDCKLNKKDVAIIIKNCIPNILNV